MATRQKFIAGNWKMHGSLAVNLGLLTAVRAGAQDLKAQVAVCVPYPYLVQGRLVLGGSNVAWGAQDVSEHAQGAYTGEVSAAMLNDFGCRYAIVGHSERRTDHKETDADVRAKAEAAWRAGLIAILCIGETEAERRGGQTEAVLDRQIAGSVPDGATAARLVIAYEPVWAIGTGLTPSLDDIRAAHTHIRLRLKQRFAAEADGVRILYGGSVKPGNAGEIMALPGVDGALVGGASLKAVDFLAIIAACR